MLDIYPGEIVFPKQLSAQNIVDFSLEVHKKSGDKAKELFERLELDPKEKSERYVKRNEAKIGYYYNICP